MFSKNYTNLLIFTLYISLLWGVYYNEDLIRGAYYDFKGLYYVYGKFNENFYLTFFNYDQLGHRQSPIFYILGSVISDNQIILRVFYVHLFLLIPLYFYKALKITFKKIDKKNLKLIASVILIFPTYRSYSIWPDPHLLGTLFFIISIYYFLKFKFFNNKLKYSLSNIFWLALASYVSPNFGVFAIYFFYEFCKIFKFNIKLFYIVSFNIILSFPFFYYLYFLNINFLFNDYGWDIGDNIFSPKNIANKIIIISSIFLFYLLPIINYSTILNDIKRLIKFNKIKIIYLFIFLLSCYEFDFSEAYKLTNSGGGIFYNISVFLFNNNYLLFLISFISFLFLVETFSTDIKNFLLFICIILSNPQTTIWQSNHSPTIFFLILLLFKIDFHRFKFGDKNIILIFSYFLMYIIANLVKISLI